jgi:hypothetical protein
VECTYVHCNTSAYAQETSRTEVCVCVCVCVCVRERERERERERLFIMNKILYNVLSRGGGQ